MRRPTLSRPPVATCLLAGLVLTLSGCDTGAGGTSATTAGRSATSTPTGGPMDQDDTGATSGTQDASAATPQVLSAGALLTNDDSGAVVRLVPGESVVLRLTPPLQGGTPQVSEPQVLEPVPVQHFADPGYDEYELLALDAGRARVEVRGSDSTALVLLVEVQGR